MLRPTESGQRRDRKDGEKDPLAELTQEREKHMEAIRSLTARINSIRQQQTFLWVDLGKVRKFLLNTESRDEIPKDGHYSRRLATLLYLRLQARNCAYDVEAALKLLQEERDLKEGRELVNRRAAFADVERRIKIATATT